MFINSTAAIGQPLAAQIGEGTFSAAPKCSELSRKYSELLPIYAERARKCSEQLLKTCSHCLGRLGPTNI